MEDYNLLANLRGGRTSRCVTPLDGARTPVGDAPFDTFGSGGCSSGGFCSGPLCHDGEQHVRSVRSRVSTVRAPTDLFDGEEGIVPSVSSRSRPRMKQGRSPRQPERTMPSVAVRRTAPVLCLRAPSAPLKTPSSNGLLTRSPDNPHSSNLTRPLDCHRRRILPHRPLFSLFQKSSSAAAKEDVSRRAASGEEVDGALASRLRTSTVAFEVMCAGEVLAFSADRRVRCSKSA